MSIYASKITDRSADQWFYLQGYENEPKIANMKQPFIKMRISIRYDSLHDAH